MYLLAFAILKYLDNEFKQIRAASHQTSPLFGAALTAFLSAHQHQETPQAAFSDSLRQIQEKKKSISRGDFPLNNKKEKKKKAL